MFVCPRAPVHYSRSYSILGEHIVSHGHHLNGLASGADYAIDQSCSPGSKPLYAALLHVGSKRQHASSRQCATLKNMKAFSTPREKILLRSTCRGEETRFTVDLSVGSLKQPLRAGASRHPQVQGLETATSR